MKKILLTTLFVFGILLGFNGLEVSAEANTDQMLGNDEHIQNAVQSYLSPSNFSGRSHTYYTFKVHTNVRGISAFSWDPGLGTKFIRTERGSGSREFREKWDIYSLKTYKIGGKAVSMDYGPGPWVYGEAVIRY